MVRLFKSILLPVYNDYPSDAEISQAVNFANKLEADLHLVLITYHSLRITKHDSSPELKFRLAKIREKYIPYLNPGLCLHTQFLEGRAETRISEYCNRFAIDLVFVYDRSRKGFFHRSIKAVEIANKVQCPVLTMKSTSLFDDRRIIVLPVGKAFPVSKIRVVIFMAKLFKADIHLITLENEGMNHAEISHMIKTFQVLKDNTDLQVTCTTVPGRSLANITLDYAHTMHAGLIVVNSKEESVLTGFINRLLSRFVDTRADVPVITVQ